MITKKFIDEIEYVVTGACIEVHRTLGPGLLEGFYHKCLIHELRLLQLFFTSEQPVNIKYKGFNLDTNLRVDLFIENCLVLELKSGEIILPVHEAQILTYMKILQAPKGLLVNFNCTNIINYGKRPFVHQFYTNLPK